LQHRHIADEVAFVRNGELLFDIVPPLDDLYFAAQNNGQTDVPLPGFVHHVAALHGTALSQRFEQRKLIIVQLGKSNAFGVSIKLLVVLLVVSHLRNLRGTQHNPNLTHAGAHLRIHSA
jgi:hypothetical protein